MTGVFFISTSFANSNKVSSQNIVDTIKNACTADTPLCKSSGNNVINKGGYDTVKVTCATINPNMAPELISNYVFRTNWDPVHGDYGAYHYSFYEGFNKATFSKYSDPKTAILKYCESIK